MGITSKMQEKMATEFAQSDKLEQLRKQANTTSESKGSIPMQEPYAAEGQQERLAFLKKTTGTELGAVSGSKAFESHSQLEGNIENFIGMAQVPIGIAGPMLVNGSEAQGEFYVPLATTEGALVASYSRGMRACRESGYITSVCTSESVQRSPLFRFKSMLDVGEFGVWLLGKLEVFQKLAKERTSHGELIDYIVNIEANTVILTFEYHTGDAAGQNMVTLCTHHICQYILQNSPVKPEFWFIESNYSGDKKATALSFTNVRGKKVSAEIVLPRKVVEEVLKTTPERMTDYWRTSTLSVVQSGAIGAQGHVANGLTAVFIACGQDAACVAEAAVGLTRMEITKNGDLYAATTLPGLIVGTVGGGTGLPTQKECLQLMDCAGSGKAKKFAEICGAMALTGELSIAAALSADHFAQAHARLGRKAK